jgi:NAD(P)-dependent dehydrogenase (short-subunit alcohol dehydrogenase family)
MATNDGAQRGVPGGADGLGGLAGKVALVTGAGSGIGRATSLRMARAGARIVVSDIDEDGGREMVDAVEQVGAEAIFVRADTASPADVRALIHTTVETYGRLDCAVNNAGVSGLPPDGRTYAPHEIPEEIWTRVIGINLTGVFLCLQQEIAQMLAQGGGAIVNLASIYGLVGARGAPYVASKHGVVGLTRSFALAYAKQGIRVNAVCPGHTETPMVASVFEARPEEEATLRGAYPMGRLGVPSEIAEAIAWLCSDAASFVTGIALPVDGGLTAQ